MGKSPQNYGLSPKYGVTQFYLQPDISEHTPTPAGEGWYSIYLPRRDGRLG